MEVAVIEATKSALAARRRTWLWWVVASTGGWVGGASVATVLSPSQSLGPSGAFVVAGGALAAGLGQWLVLRTEIDHAVRWMVATIAAVGVVAGLVLAIELLDWGSAVALGGLALGVLQWTVLRRHVEGAGWWILASTAAWIFGGLLSGATGPPAGWAIIGATYGAVTATALVLLLEGTRRDATPGGIG